MIRFYVEPPRLLPDGDSYGSVEDVLNGTCSTLLRQLSSLALGAELMFSELTKMVVDINGRTDALGSKFSTIRSFILQLNPAKDEIARDELLKPFHSSQSRRLALGERPDSLTMLYHLAESVPPLEKLNAVRQDGKDCRKLYSNPGHFFELWSDQVAQEVEKKRPAKAKRKKRNKLEQIRKPVNTKLQLMRQKVGDEAFTGQSGTTRKFPDNSEAGQTSESTVPHREESSASRLNPDNSNYSPQTKSSQDQNLPPLSLQRVSSNSGNSVRSPPTLMPKPKTPVPGSALAPLPPPPPPPPSVCGSEAVPMRNAGVPLMRGGQKSIYVVQEFDRSTVIFPPPPPPILNGCEDMGHAYPPPPPPPALPVPPPAPDISGFGLRKDPVVRDAPVKRSVSKKRQSRGDLLESIRSGIQLRKTDGGKEATGGKSSAGVGMFDVQAILEMRRRVLEDDDDDSDEGEEDADWND